MPIFILNQTDEILNSVPNEKENPQQLDLLAEVNLFMIEKNLILPQRCNTDKKKGKNSQSVEIL